jgi:hypothetical protein
VQALQIAARAAFSGEHAARVNVAADALYRQLEANERALKDGLVAARALPHAHQRTCELERALEQLLAARAALEAPISTHGDRDTCARLAALVVGVRA